MNSGKPKNPAIVFLAKPYDIKTLAATVRRCMNRAGAAGYHARSSLVVGLLFAVCTGLLLTYQLTKARTLQMEMLRTVSPRSGGRCAVTAYICANSCGFVGKGSSSVRAPRFRDAQSAVQTTAAMVLVGLGKIHFVPNQCNVLRYQAAGPAAAFVTYSMTGSAQLHGSIPKRVGLSSRSPAAFRPSAQRLRPMVVYPSWPPQVDSNSRIAKFGHDACATKRWA